MGNILKLIKRIFRYFIYASPLLYLIIFLYFIVQVIDQNDKQYIHLFLFLLWIISKIFYLEKDKKYFQKFFSLTFLLFFIVSFRYNLILEWNLNYFSNLFLIFFILLSFIIWIKNDKKINNHVSFISLYIYTMSFIYIWYITENILILWVNFCLFLLLSLWYILNFKENGIKNIFFILSIFINFFIFYLYLEIISWFLYDWIKYNSESYVITFLLWFSIIYVINSLYKIFLIIPKRYMSYCREVIPIAKKYYLVNISTRPPKAYDLFSIIILISIVLLWNYHFLHLDGFELIFITYIIIEIYYDILTIYKKRTSD